MTVRLKVQYGKYPPNTNLTTGVAEEMRLLREGLADNGAGVEYVAPMVPHWRDPVSTVDIGNGPQIVSGINPNGDPSFAGTVSATPSGNLVVGGVAGAPLRLLSTVGSSTFKNQDVFGRGGNAQYTTHIKSRAARPFYRVVVCVRNKDPLALADFNFALAVTEDPRNDTAARAYQPIVGGVVQNVAQDNNNPYGWLVGNFTGGSAGLVFTTTGKLTYEMRSLPVALQSVPCLDGLAPIALARVNHGAASLLTISNAEIVSGDEGLPGDRMFRRRQLAGDGVASFASMPAGTDDSNCFDVYLEYQYITPGLFALATGNSITQNFSDIGWFATAMRLARAGGAVIDGNSVAVSGSAYTEFTAGLEASMALGCTPSHILLPCITPNPTMSGLPQAIATSSELLRLLLVMRNKGIAAIVWDGCPNNNYAANNQQAVNYCRAKAREYAAAGLCRYVEMGRSVTANYGDPTGEKYIVGTNNDNIHPNQASAANLMAPVMAAAFLSL